MASTLRRRLAGMVSCCCGLLSDGVLLVDCQRWIEDVVCDRVMVGDWIERKAEAGPASRTRSSRIALAIESLMAGCILERLGPRSGCHRTSINPSRTRSTSAITSTIRLDGAKPIQPNGIQADVRGPPSPAAHTLSAIRPAIASQPIVDTTTPPLLCVCLPDNYREWEQGTPRTTTEIATTAPIHPPPNPSRYEDRRNLESPIVQLGSERPHYLGQRSVRVAYVALSVG